MKVKILWKIENFPQKSHPQNFYGLVLNSVNMALETKYTMDRAIFGGPAC